MPEEPGQRFVGQHEDISCCSYPNYVATSGTWEALEKFVYEVRSASIRATGNPLQAYEARCK